MNTNLISSVFVALGLVAAGWQIGNAIQDGNATKRIIEVRGLAEKEVQSDFAVWNLGFSAPGDSLTEAMENVAKHREIVTQFLIRQGFKAEEIVRNNITVEDTWANGGTRPPQRFNARASVILGTRNIAALSNAGQTLEDLLKAGVRFEYPSIEYRYTQLNSIKPAMLTEATANAKKAAESFAKDSDAEITGLAGATQGLFSIASPNGDYDDPASVIKKVRVVTQMRYTIK